MLFCELCKCFMQDKKNFLDFGTAFLTYYITTHSIFEDKSKRKKL